MPDRYHNTIYYKKHRVTFRDQKIIGFIKKNFKKTEELNFLDVGCANGDLIFLLSKIFKKSNFTGIDIDKKTLTYAKKRMKQNENCKFIHSNLVKFNPSQKFDVIIASGLLSFFENFKDPFKTLIKLMNRKTKSGIFLFGRFNSSNIDTFIKFRDNDSKSKKWRDGLHSFSINTIANYLKTKKLNYKFFKFNLPINLKKNKKFLTTYTLKLMNNKRIILNSANIIAEYYHLVIKRNN